MYTARQIKNFWNKVTIPNDSSQCWTWKGAKGRKGYGQVNCDCKCLKAHRVSWELANGEIPDGLWVLHSCDNPACVNPNHLFLGTQHDNTQDMMNKKRQFHKLTHDQMEMACRKIIEGESTPQELANELGVSSKRISEIIRYANSQENKS